MGGIADGDINEGAVVLHQDAGLFVGGDDAGGANGICPKVRGGDAERVFGGGLDIGIVCQDGDLGRSRVVAHAAGASAGEQHVLIAGVGGAIAVPDAEAEVVPRDGGAAAVVIDVQPSPGAGLANGGEGGGLGEVVTDVRAAHIACEVSPGGAGERLRPTQGAGFFGVIHGEGIGSVGGEFAILHDGFDGAIVGAGDACAEADDFIIKHEPGLLACERDGNAFELHPRCAVVAQGGTADPVVR